MIYPATEPRFHVYLHCLIGRAKSREIIAEIQSAIVFSGLYDAATTLNAITVGDGDTSKLWYPRWRVTRGGTPDDFEFPTLQALHEHAKREPEAVFLYLHSKGATRDDQLGHIWRKMMLAGVVGKWRQALEMIRSVDSVGCFFKSFPANHFSGNQWYVRGSAVKDLPTPEPTDEYPGRLFAEYWNLSGGASYFDLLPDPATIHDQFRSQVYRHSITHENA